MAAGRGATFAYTGAAGTVPLPIFLAYFNAQNALERRRRRALYTGTNWTSAAFLGYLARNNPNPFGFMCNNAGGCTTRNRHQRPDRPGRRSATMPRRRVLPANFFVANPDALNGAYLTTNYGGTQRALDAVRVPQASVERARVQHQLYLERCVRCSGTASPEPLEWHRAGRSGRQRRARPEGQLDLGTALVRPIAITAAVFRNRRCQLLGGWSFDGVARIQTGEQLDFGNVRLVGMSQKDLQKAIKLATGCQRADLHPARRHHRQHGEGVRRSAPPRPTGYGALGAPTGRYIAPANGPSCIESAPGYGDCGLRNLVVNGPNSCASTWASRRSSACARQCHVRIPRRDAERVQLAVLQPGIRRRHAAGHDHLRTNPGGPAATGQPISTPTPAPATARSG